MIAQQHSAAARALWFASVLLGGACLTSAFCQRAACDVEEESSLPPAIEKLVRWLPENAETIVVAQSFKIPRARQGKQADPSEPIWGHLQDLSLCGLTELEPNAGLDELEGREVAIAVNGARDFTVVSAFGSLRYQGCSIIKFKEPLPDEGRTFVDALRKNAKEVRTIAEKDVFVFPDRTAMESTFKPKKWQGQYITLPSADTLLCASSDRFLREVLERSMRKSDNRALAMKLPEWKYIDPAAPIWALRHIPPKLPGQLAAGVTWCLKPHARNVLEVTYTPIEGKDPLPLAQIWKAHDLDARPSIDEKSDGAVVLTIDLIKEKRQLWYAFPIYWSMGEIGQPQASMTPADRLKLINGDGSGDEVAE